MKTRFATLSLTILALALSTSAFAGTIFDDGPTNGQVNALFIDGPGPGPFSQSITDGFAATGSGNAGSLDFGLWVPTGTTPTNISWSIGTTPLGTDIGSGSTTNLTNTFLTSNGFGFDVYNVHIDGLSGSMTAGTTYFLTLGGANDSGGTQLDGWDVNAGPASCQFAVGGTLQGDCGLGNPEGEAFTLSTGGTTSTTSTTSTTGTTPEPSSIMLFGSGVLGLAGVLRRKLSR